MRERRPWTCCGASNFPPHAHLPEPANGHRRGRWTCGTLAVERSLFCQTEIVQASGMLSGSLKRSTPCKWMDDLASRSSSSRGSITGRTPSIGCAEARPQRNSLGWLQQAPGGLLRQPNASAWSAAGGKLGSVCAGIGRGSEKLDDERQHRWRNAVNDLCDCVASV